MKKGQCGTAKCNAAKCKFFNCNTAKNIGAALVGILLVLMLTAALQSSHFSVSRSATINAPAWKVFVQVNDLHNWNEWSPWAKMDPEAKNEFKGPRSGRGATLNWDGNRKVGKGSMKITESRPYKRVKFDLAFEKPMKDESTATFDFASKAGKTTVTWSMQGERGYMGKLMGLIFGCERIIGNQFDKGLDNLAARVEKR